MLRAKIFLLVSLLCGHQSQVVYRRGLGTENYPTPPSPMEKAKTSRYVIHYTDWAIVSTISTIKEIKGKPFSNLFSFCDGTIANGTGVPYFYVSDLDISMQDVLKNPSISLTVTEAQTEYCKTRDFDQEDPRCAKLTLSGKMVNITSGEEKQFAKKSLFERHPLMASWPGGIHNFYFTKMEIDMVWLLDYFGGGTVVPLENYYAAQP